MPKHFFAAIATLIGMTVGAGILGIPYVISQSGFISGIFIILLIGASVAMLNLYFSEIVLRTRGDHQLPGYAKKYLGKFGEYLMIIFMFVGFNGALAAYLVKIGEFLNTLFSPFIGGNPLLYSILFFIVSSFIIFKGLKLLEESETILVPLIFITLTLIMIFSINYINVDNLKTFYPSKILFPFGVILFAFMGIAAIPEMKDELRHNKKLLKKAIIIGMIIVAAIYILFALAIVGITGKITTDAAIAGLAKYVGHKMMLLGILFGSLTITTSYISIGIALKEMYDFDFKVKKKLSSFLSCLFPLIIFLSLNKIENAFYKIMDFIGLFEGALITILILGMISKVKKMGNRKPEYSIPFNKVIGIILAAIFFLGIINMVFKVI